MEQNYETKEIRASKNKMQKPKGKVNPPSHDGAIFEKDGMFFFKWKGSECGYLTKEAAEDGLLKVSGKFKEED
jgi:hypothetical protein